MESILGKWLIVITIILMKIVIIYPHDDGDLRLLALRGSYKISGLNIDSKTKYEYDLSVTYGNGYYLEIFRKSEKKTFRGSLYTKDDPCTELKEVIMEWSDDSNRYVGIYKVKYDHNGIATMNGNIFLESNTKKVLAVEDIISSNE